MAAKTTPPAQQQAPAADSSTAQDPEAGRIQALDDRFGAIETEQREQRGILDKVLAAVTPGGDAAPPGGHAAGSGAASGAAPLPSPAAAIAQQVRDEIAAADARRAQQDADKAWRDDVTATVEKVKAEQQPRPPQTGIRARLQRAMIGKTE